MQKKQKKKQIDVKALWFYIAELSYFIWSVVNALKVQKAIHYLVPKPLAFSFNQL